MKTILLIVALGVVSSAYGAEASKDKDPKPSGKAAYVARCAKCHGESGTGTFMLSRRLGKEKGMLESRTDLSPELIRHVVRNGIVSMPAITRVEVTDDELRAITDYLTRT